MIWVLSQWLGPLGFVVLSSIASLLYVMGRGVNTLVIAFAVAALAWPALCAAYRWWFVQWGRRNWPHGRPS